MKPARSAAFKWVLRPGIGRRIALTMILSLFAVQTQAFLQVWLLSDPQVRLVGTRWLSEATVEASLRIMSAEDTSRDAIVANLNREPSARFAWSKEKPVGRPDEQSELIAGRLKATVVNRLGIEARDVAVLPTPLRFHVPFETMRFSVRTGTLAAPLGDRALTPDEPEILIPATLRLVIQLRDGTWLTVSPFSFESGGYQSLPWTPLLVAGMIIVVVSTMLARRIVAPLDRLVVAADRIGTAREPVSVQKEGLYEFAAVAQAFEDMQRRLLRFVDDRTQMLAAISHDLRSSLTRMRLATEDVAGEPERAALSTEIDDMQAMVDSTLAFATDEARSTPNQITDIASLLISLADEFSDIGHACSYDGPVHVEVMGHPVSLKRAFRNLLDNAVKYGGKVRVYLDVHGPQIRITIEDDGPGIPADRVDEAFAPFRRLNTARSQPGAGLGLTIARDVVHSHGGSLALGRSDNDCFAVFIEIPRLVQSGESF